MVAGGCAKCIKYSLFVFNFLFWVAGCCLIGFGLYLLLSDKATDKADEDDNTAEEIMKKIFTMFRSLSIVIIIVGAVIMIIAFMGCCGAIRESQCLLVCFFICMLVILLALIAGAVLVFIYRKDIDKYVEDALDEDVKLWNDAKADERKDVKFVIIGQLQKSFNCCGADNWSDYKLKTKLTPLNFKVSLFPSSCKVAMENLVKEGIAKLIAGTLPKTGCTRTTIKYVKTKLEDQSLIIGAIALAVVFVIILALVMSCFLCCRIRRSESYDA